MTIFGLLKIKDIQLRSKHNASRIVKWKGQLRSRGSPRWMISDDVELADGGPLLTTPLVEPLLAGENGAVLREAAVRLRELPVLVADV